MTSPPKHTAANVLLPQPKLEFESLIFVNDGPWLSEVVEWQLLCETREEWRSRVWRSWQAPGDHSPYVPYTAVVGSYVYPQKLAMRKAGVRDSCTSIVCEHTVALPQKGPRPGPGAEQRKTTDVLSIKAKIYYSKLYNYLLIADHLSAVTTKAQFRMDCIVQYRWFVAIGDLAQTACATPRHSIKQPGAPYLISLGK